MKIDWITVRVIWQMIYGFFLSLLILAFLSWIIVSVFFPDNSPSITQNINDNYYFVKTTNGFATTSTVTTIDIYKRRKWLPDKKVGEIDKYVYGKEDIVIAYDDKHLTMLVNQEIKVDTLIDLDEGLWIDPDKWLEIEYVKR